ncbi:MAG TPA: CDP-diacylglycerol--glycerol-3-phosphate 3-phosphatidyltransferase [Vitreimonas sp.]|nr:CDP-diacylglycerol--glycerol-3-phosphate 3-phosphatidyltransferase [Vitreimonas sp.]
MTTSTTSTELPRHTTLPMVLTISRMALGPVIAGLILTALTYVYTDRILAGLIYAVALVVFLIAAATDWLDGYFARKLNAVTPLGAALDHCADKVLIACTLLALAYAALPLDLVVAAVIVLGRDIAVAGLREGLSNSGRTLPVGSVGKWKAAAEMAGVGAFLAYAASALLTDSASIVVGLNYAARILLWAGAGLALISAGQYVGAAMKPAPKA